MRRSIVAATLAMGCGYPQADFEADFAETACAMYESCDQLSLFNYETADDCLAGYEMAYESEPQSCDKYRGGKAKKCLKNFEELSCGDLESLEVLPEPCSDVCE